MKTGIYQVTFTLDLMNCKNEDDAIDAVKAMCKKMLKNDEFPEVEFELLEEMDLEYILEEDEVQELPF